MRPQLKGLATAGKLTGPVGLHSGLAQPVLLSRRIAHVQATPTKDQEAGVCFKIGPVLSFFCIMLVASFQVAGMGHAIRRTQPSGQQQGLQNKSLPQCSPTNAGTSPACRFRAMLMRALLEHSGEAAASAANNRGSELDHQFVSGNSDACFKGADAEWGYALALVSAALLTRLVSDTSPRSPWARWSRSSWQLWLHGTLKVGRQLRSNPVACVRLRASSKFHKLLLPFRLQASPASVTPSLRH
jgi:hypothetical protein